MPKLDLLIRASVCPRLQDLRLPLLRLQLRLSVCTLLTGDLEEKKKEK